MKRLLLLITICISSVSFGQVPSYVPTNGLVGWWGFNGNANDESGNGHNGTVVGPSLTADRFGNPYSAYEFDGLDDEIFVLDNNDLDLQQFTISGWVKPNTNDVVAREIAAKGQFPYNYGINLSGTGNNMNGFYNDNNAYQQISSISNVSIGDWAYVVLTHNGNTAKLYINGVLENSSNNSQVVVNNGLLYFGRTYTGYFMNGTLDDIGLWGRALTQCEISELYHAQVLPPPVLAMQDTLSACGASTTLDAGTDPAWASYLWNTSETTQTISVSNPGLYTVQVTDTNGCIGYDTTLVSIIDPTINQIDTNICIGDSMVLNVCPTGTSCMPLPQNLQNGLVAHYPFCGNANDESGNGNDGTVIGATLTTDRFCNENSAYYFDGVDDYIEVLDHSSLDLTTNMTLAAWFKMDVNNLDQGILGKGSTDPNQTGYALLINVSNPAQSGFVLQNPPTFIPQESYTMLNLAGDWHYMVGTFDGSIMKTYIDGQLVASFNTNITLPNSASSLFFGKELPVYRYFEGKIDDVSIWNQALTPSEIQQLYELGQYDITWSTGDTTSSITVQPTTTTTYTVTVSDGISSCVDDVTITVNDPQVDAGVDVDVCNGDDITLSGAGADTYAWSGGVTDGVAFGPTVSEYYYVTGTDAFGCEDIDSVFVNILQPTTSSITEAVCETYTAPDGATYTSTGTYTAVVPNAVGCDSTITIDLTITNSTSSSITATVCDTYTAPDGTTYTSTGNYTAVIPNAVGCDSTIALNLTINNLTSLDAGVDQTVCEGTDVTLTATGAASYAWSGGVSNGTPFPAEAGTTTYTVEGTDANGCTDQQSVNVTGTSYPELVFDVTNPACQGEASGSVTVVVNNGTSPFGFLWSNGVLQANNENIGAGSYSVTVTDDNGCESSGNVVVVDPSEPCFYISDGISPNGDGANDTWIISGLSSYPDAKVSVFNRWGQEVYSGTASSAPWDGTDKGKELPTADYYYVLDLGNGQTYNGVVTLKK